MRHVYTQPLGDEELRSHLERGDTITFTEVATWQEVERQVDRLGFGEQYTVSRGGKRGPTGPRSRTRVSPFRHSKEE